MRLEQFANPKGQGVPEALFFVGGRARSGRLCGNQIFSVYPLRPRPQGPKIGLNHPRIAGIPKTVPFRTPAAGPAAIRSAFMIEADQTLTAAACPQMTRSGHSSI